MQTSYIYSASRVNALAQFLLSKTDIERLLVAEPGADLELALKETYLAPYVARVATGHVPDAIEQTLIEAKKLIHRIAPRGNMFRVLWVHYDLHNLRVFAKALRYDWSFEQCLPYVSQRGIYDPEYLYAQVQSQSLDALRSGWQAAFNQAVAYVTVGEIDKVDGVFDGVYFATSHQIAVESKDEFIRTYHKQMADLYNLKSQLRHLKNPQVSFTPFFVTGGSFAADQIETLDQVLATFSRLGGAEFWCEALEYYQATGNTTRIDARADEYLLTCAKTASRDMFSSASLVLYYLLCRQAAANVRTIVVGRNSGMSETDIRANLRMAYVNE